MVDGKFISENTNPLPEYCKDMKCVSPFYAIEEIDKNKHPLMSNTKAYLKMPVLLINRKDISQ
ncbi:hypothetical protein CWI36_1030p0010 [Hamiltosporidium magnivora]|uniref:Uncharacterized protein n=1 Tax=Hamiltosporidium magnivora TaxID=148818 RepID=A0A4Q9L6P7_9MICR|nr:hypothetical protein CWI36_1030p0010 [Hamiltosporidium magnivora]